MDAHQKMTAVAEEKTLTLPDSLEVINDYFYQHSWTDGLPIIPPTAERVKAMVEGIPWRDSEDILAVLPPANGKATIQKIAINAVMAGCLPSYMPIITAAVQAVSEPVYGLGHRQTTTHAGAPLIIVNGPIVERIGLNYGNGVFGPGWRANATIGRALRLILINIGGAIPGEVDFCQHGHPGKYTFCIAEHEKANPWNPLHVERGFKRDASVVTVVNAEAPHSMTENVQTDPNEIVRTFASTMAALGSNNIYSQGTPVLVLGPEHAGFFAAASWSKEDLKQALFDRARQPWVLIRNRGKSKGPHFPQWIDRNNENAMVPIVSRPEDLIVIVAGGAGGKSMWCATAGAQSLGVSKPVECSPESIA